MTRKADMIIRGSEHAMFLCDYTKLRLSFNEFHNVEVKDMPEYGEFCLLELKDGRHTAGKWYPNGDEEESVSGDFGRGTADSVDVDEVSKWHSLDRYDLTDCLENEEINLINLGAKKEDIHNIMIGDFKSLQNGDLPKHKQYCLLILTNGELSAGRWDQWQGEKRGTFIYASALASHSMDKVWAWTALSYDDIFAREEEREKERLLEEELNRNPSVDQNKFKYGTDINVYYEKALEKLCREYPWATLTQMKKKTAYVIVPRHGQYIFGQDNGTFMGSKIIKEWTDGSSADEFIDFLCEYTKDAVQNSNPEVKFKFGMDIEVYLEMAYENVKKEYSWLDKNIIREAWHYAIKHVDGESEFVREYNDSDDFTVCDCSCAEDFIESVEYDYKQAAMRANPVVDEYELSFGYLELHGWNLENS